MSGIRLIGEVSDETREDLRDTLLYCCSEFGVYKSTSHALGLTRDDILRDDPVETLQRLPLLEGVALHELTEDSLGVGEQIVDIETSSGTTGPRKRRFISYGDEVSETEFLTRLFGVCGIGAPDRVACLDTDPLTLMVSFTKGLDLLGVQESYAYCIGRDFDGTIAALPNLDPTVIITVPSILERCYEALRRAYRGAISPGLKKIVYVGEPPTAGMRSSLESEFGVEVFGYYGSSETSALGIECGEHDGIHLFTDRNVIEMVADGDDGLAGEIVVTTLRQKKLPLLRYALRDTIALRPGECDCGLSFPRVEVRGRAGDGFSILGAKINFRPIQAAVYGDADAPGPMQLVLNREGHDSLTVVLPQRMQRNETTIMESLLTSQTDIDFLVDSRFLDLRFEFVDDSYFGQSRKRKRIVDLRQSRDE